MIESASLLAVAPELVLTVGGLAKRLAGPAPAPAPQGDAEAAHS